jgi:hypothetical protein
MISVPPGAGSDQVQSIKAEAIVDVAEPTYQLPGSVSPSRIVTVSLTDFFTLSDDNDVNLLC